MFQCNTMHPGEKANFIYCYGMISTLPKGRHRGVHIVCFPLCERVESCEHSTPVEGGTGNGGPAVGWQKVGSCETGLERDFLRMLFELLEFEPHKLKTNKHTNYTI